VTIIDIDPPSTDIDGRLMNGSMSASLKFDPRLRAYFVIATALSLCCNYPATQY